MALLKLDGILINLGTTEALEDVPGCRAPRSRRSTAASVGGSRAETKAVIDYCAAHHISPEIELIRPDQIPRVVENVALKRSPYRYVIDFASGRPH